MDAVGFPISREAACCGIYIYLETNRVGLMSKDALRRANIKLYEDAFVDRLQKKKDLFAKKKTRDESVPSLKSINSGGIYIENDVGYEGSGYWDKPIEVLQIENSSDNLYGAIWSAPVESVQVDSISVDKPISSRIEEYTRHGVELGSIVVEPRKSSDGCSLLGIELRSSEEEYGSSSRDTMEEKEYASYDYMKHGVELFSVKVEKAVTSEETEEISPSMLDDVGDFSSYYNGISWTEDDAEDNEVINEAQGISWVEDNVEEPKYDIWGNIITQEKHEDLKEDTVVSKSQKTYIQPEPIVERQFARQNSVNKSPKIEKESKSIKETTLSTARLDESSIRDFVKSHRLCSEQDIVKYFSSYEPVKVKSCIKSAARHYKIFEKHGKFTV